MAFDPRNSSWYPELDPKSKRVLRRSIWSIESNRLLQNSKQKIDKTSGEYRERKRMRLIMNIAERLLEPIEGYSFEYLEKNIAKLFESREKEAREQVIQETKEEVKKSVRGKFLFGYRRACALGFGLEVHCAIYEMYRNRKFTSSQKQIYTMIQSIALELILELKRAEQIQTIRKSPFGRQPLKAHAN